MTPNDPRETSDASPGVTAPSESPTSIDPDRFTLVASPRHTTRFVAVLLVLAALGALAPYRISAGASERSHVAQYLILIALEWLLFVFALAGLRGRGTSLRSIIGGRWRSAWSVLATLLTAALFLVLAHFVLEGVERFMDWIGQSTRVEEGSTLTRMAPHGGVESALWILVSMSAGFCEEVVYRGYLQRQLTALTRRPAAGILLSALIFGVGHAYQGRRSVVVITAYGLLFGLLARITRSLRPGMIAHAGQDVLSILFRI